MQRLVIVTSVYVSWFNAGRHEKILLKRDGGKHLSAVVLMELRAGASSTKDRRVVQQVEAKFAGARRILVPSGRVYAEAGDVLRQLRVRRGFSLGGRRSIVNDVLIALSARSIGATVATQNERDYTAIRAVTPFQLVVVRS